MNPMPELLALRNLVRAAEEQLLAARTANVEELTLATARRAEAQEALDVPALRRAAPDVRAEAARLAMRVRAFDVRLRTCGETVLAAITSMDPERAPTTYGRRGQLRSA